MTWELEAGGHTALAFRNNEDYYCSAFLVLPCGIPLLRIKATKFP